jgi:hypothetical protein
LSCSSIIVEVEVLEEDNGHVVNDAGGVGQPSGKDLSDQARFGAYFAMQFIQTRDGKVDKKDKELVASQLKTSLSTVEKSGKKHDKKLQQGKK